MLSLDGTFDYVEVNNSASLGITKTFTIEAWVKLEADSQNFLRKPGAYLLEFGGRDFGFEGKRVQVVLWSQEHQLLRLVESEFDFELGGCYHVAAVYDQKVGRIYINGQLDVEENREGFTGDVAVSDENLKIGYWFSPYRDVHESFFGQVDEIRIFNIARTHQEILSTMNRPLTGGEEGLVGYWNFDSGTANDKSKFGNHGRLKGNAQIVAASIPNFTP